MRRYDDNGNGLHVYSNRFKAIKRVPTLERGDSLHGGVDENWLLNDFIALRLKYWKHPDRQGRRANKSNNGYDGTGTSATVQSK